MAQASRINPLDFTKDNFPALNQKKKVRFDLQESDTSTAESTDPDLSCGGVLVDFDTEMAKEREINEQRMVDIKNELMTEIYNRKQNSKRK
jgi:hypothetical protein